MPKFTSDNQPKQRQARGKAKLGLLAQKLEENEAELADTVLNLALSGDITALKLAIDRLHPQPRATLPKIDKPIRGKTIADKARAIANAAARGELTPDQAQALLAAMKSAADIIEFEEIEARLSALEAKQ